MTNLNLYTMAGSNIAPFERAMFDLVIYDLDTTLDLSMEYTTTSVITNLAHIIEGWSSAKRSPCKSTNLLHPNYL